MTINPTAEQLAVIDAARDTADNLLVSALAGAAKTTTLELIAHEITKPMLCLAFNKRIATEMQRRLPPHCTAMTLNSLGHRAWGETIGRRLRIDPRKNYELLKAAVDELPADQKSEVYADFADTLHMIAFGKSCGWVPNSWKGKSHRLMDDEAIFDHFELEPTPLQWDLIRRISHESLDQAHLGNCDYDDQLLCPTVFTALLPRYPLVLVDEAQDLSALNHQLLQKLVRQRLIAVGDECQSIYGFRGAHQDSMNVLRAAFEMTELKLSISFRCPRTVVREAQWRAPHMQWPDWAEEGRVERLDSWEAATLPDEAAIICRNNAPLFAMAVRLLKNGRYPQIVGGDIGRHLGRLMKKLGKPTMMQSEAKDAVLRWEEERLAKARDHGKVRDQAACMRIFLEQGKTLGDAIAYAEHLLSRAGPIQLMTGHKSKGLEFDHVYFLDQHLVRDEQQDKNLRYVIQTRAKQTLTYIDSEEFEDKESEEG